MSAAGKPKPVQPRGPTDAELLTDGEVTPEQAPVDTLPETEEERAAVTNPDPKWVDGAMVSAKLAARLRGG